MSSKTVSVRKVIPIVAQEPQEKIYPRSVAGYFSRWRWATVFLTQCIFYGMPWLEWGQRQTILFDLGSRRFYIFGLVLYPQDFIYLTGILVISALALFLFTAVAGRLWCGYACPQTVYTEIFLWIEKRIEGDRSARMRRDAQPLSFGKFGRKSAKHAVWLAVALWTGFTFVGYFTPIKELGAAVLQMNMGSWEIFWALFYGFATRTWCRRASPPLRPPRRSRCRATPDGSRPWRGSRAQNSSRSTATRCNARHTFPSARGGTASGRTTRAPGTP